MTLPSDQASDQAQEFLMLGTMSLPQELYNLDQGRDPA